MKAYACQNKISEERLNSSSGAVFPLIARYILSENGVVYGAAYDDKFCVKHIRVTDTSELDQLYGSKYVFSDFNIFQDVLRDLDSGKNVLFVGTPCQVNGLCSFLKKEYSNLFLIDFVCHGCPSKDIWKKYIESLKRGRTIKKITFRDKTEGWENYKFTILYDNGDKYSVHHGADLYMYGFSSNLILRRACFSCKSKGQEHRKSDITIGDLWGASDLAPNLYDNKGTSILIINTQKGEAILDSINSGLLIQDVDIDKAISINWAYLKPVTPSKYYEKFFTELGDNKNIISLLKKYKFLIRVSHIVEKTKSIFRI